MHHFLPFAYSDQGRDINCIESPKVVLDIYFKWSVLQLRFFVNENNLTNDQSHNVLLHLLF